MDAKAITAADAVQIIQHGAWLARQLVLQGDSIKGILVHAAVYALAGEHAATLKGEVHATDSRGTSTFYVLGITEVEAARLGIRGFRRASAAFTEEEKDVVLRLIGRS